MNSIHIERLPPDQKVGRSDVQPQTFLSRSTASARLKKRFRAPHDPMWPPTLAGPSPAGSTTESTSVVTWLVGEFYPRPKVTPMENCENLRPLSVSAEVHFSRLFARGSHGLLDEESIRLPAIPRPAGIPRIVTPVVALQHKAQKF